MRAWMSHHVQLLFRVMSMCSTHHSIDTLCHHHHLFFFFFNGILGGVCSGSLSLSTVQYLMCSMCVHM